MSKIVKAGVPLSKVKDPKPGPGVSKEEAAKVAEKAKVAPQVPVRRKLVIDTDGQEIKIVVQEVTVLEIKEIARQLLRNFGG